MGGGPGAHGVRDFLGQPGQEYAGKTFEDYLHQGPNDAPRCIEQATGEKQ